MSIFGCDVETAREHLINTGGNLEEAVEALLNNAPERVQPQQPAEQPELPPSPPNTVSTTTSTLSESAPSTPPGAPTSLSSEKLKERVRAVLNRNPRIIHSLIDDIISSLIKEGDAEKYIEYDNRRLRSIIERNSNKLIDTITNYYCKIVDTAKCNDTTTNQLIHYIKLEASKKSSEIVDSISSIICEYLTEYESHEEPKASPMYNTHPESLLEIINDDGSFDLNSEFAKVIGTNYNCLKTHSPEIIRMDGGDVFWATMLALSYKNRKELGIDLSRSEVIVEVFCERNQLELKYYKNTSLEFIDKYVEGNFRLLHSNN
eukprot:TRINITY_DN8153_c0_g1_i1.p1 TRINITY_DN8153_c0_g1~~TRINITY_DN8153_c0_g1_i1.p1  ORF type:complete len:348 (-),score=32.06 TRINITY_DN8153_c0_g1_i1:40-993(-)